MTLTKARIVEALFAQNIFTRTLSAQVIDALFELIKQSLQNGEDVLISGFAKFSVREKPPRRGSNPQTVEREEMTLFFDFYTRHIVKTVQYLPGFRGVRKYFLDVRLFSQIRVQCLNAGTAFVAITKGYRCDR